jgi:hypothetical protein
MLQSQTLAHANLARTLATPTKVSGYQDFIEYAHGLTKHLQTKLTRPLILVEISFTWFSHPTNPQNKFPNYFIYFTLGVSINQAT